MPEEIEQWTKKGKVRKSPILPEDEEIFRKAREAEPEEIVTRPEESFYARRKGRELTQEEKESLREEQAYPYGMFSVPALGEYVGDWNQTYAYKFDSPAYVKWIEFERGGNPDDEDPLPIPRVFYHITPLSRVKNILRKGLIPGSANVAGEGIRLPGIYVTDNVEDAVGMFTGGYEAKSTREKKFALLEIRPTKNCYVGEDPELDQFGLSYILFCTIPPSNIKVLRTFTKPKDVEDAKDIKIKESLSPEDSYKKFLEWQEGKKK